VKSKIFQVVVFVEAVIEVQRVVTETCKSAHAFQVITTVFVVSSSVTEATFGAAVKLESISKYV
jgi:hypothetical protein